MPTLSSLLAPVTASNTLATMLALMKTLGLPTTSWQDGSVPLTIAESVSEIYADASEAVSAIAAGGYLDLAEGDWLTLLAQGLFQVDRTAATNTVGVATLYAATGAGPEVIAVGQLVAADANGRTYRNTTGGTLPLSGSLQLGWQSESPGSDYNIANNTLTVLLTPLPGVTINNPDPGSGSWITTAARDEESDAALRERCRTRWATLAVQAPADAYRYWARTASEEITRVFVDDQNPDGPGTVRVYCASDTGPATGGAVTLADAYIQERRAISSQITVLPAVQKAIPITATVYATAALAPTVAECELAVTTYFSALDIGGDIVAPLAPANVFTDQVELALLSLPGVKSVTLVAPSADVPLLDNEVAVPTPFTIAVVLV